MNDHDLDNLLRDALRGDPPADQVKRLAQFWRGQQETDRRHRRVYGVALVASLAFVATGVAWLLNRPTDVHIDQQVEKKGPVDVESPQSPPLDAGHLADDAGPAKPPAGRPATPYEQIMFRLSVVQAARSEAPVAELNPEAALEQLEERVGLAGLPGIAETTPHPALRRAILRRLLEVNDDIALRGYLSLVANGLTRVEALAAAEQIIEPPIDALFALLRDDSKLVRTSAAMALGRINGPEVTASLITLVTQDRSAPAEAWIALLACRDQSATEFIAGAAQHPRMLGRLNNARIFWQTIQ